MITYYIDEPLSAPEQAMVIEQINSININNIDHLEFKKLIADIPKNDGDLTHAQIIKVFEDTLIKLGAAAGLQSAFILPKGGLSWGMLLQIAFKNVSKFYPFVIQPWEMGADKVYIRRERILVTNINSDIPD